MSHISRQEQEGRRYRQQKLAFARSLRRELTPSERQLWAKLRGRRLNGTKFYRQVPMGPYIADFLCFSHALVVEVDGSVHANRADYDRERDSFFNDCGYTVLRVSNDDVENGKALSQIYAALEENKEMPTPLSPRERGWG